MFDSESVEYNLKRDLHYINKEIIAKQPNGNYCKFSRILNAVTVIDISQEQIIKYWTSRYTKNSDAYNQIVEAVHNKLTKGLISTDKMMQMIANSNDFDSEKHKAIDKLGGIYES